MKKITILILITAVFTNCNSQKNSYENEIKQFQYELNTEYADATTSPLTKEDLKTFKSLTFFDINENFKIEAEFTLTPNSPLFEMPTTTDRLPLYKKYGIATFTLNNKTFHLSIYQSQQLMSDTEYEDYLFLPFNDITNGDTSYGGGRFIDLKTPKEGAKTIIIDFNKAYNPYCAYSDRYSCPIPPKENNMDIAITAGVKAFGKHH